ncbi:MAG TPA: hypothetical protein EYG85_09765 [Crocinitomix sp.]|nr:hypothetical protein [Crocinitomix sp.]
MKNIIKFIITLTLIINISCNSDENKESYGEGYNSGWLEMAGFDHDEDESTDVVFETTINYDESIEIPVMLNSGTNENGINVTYNISLEDGYLDNPSILGEKTFMVEKHKYLANIDFSNTTISSGNYKLKFTLLSTDDGEFQVGLSDGSQPIEFLLNVTNSVSYDAVPVVTSGGSDYNAPEYVAKISAIGGTNGYSVDDFWGPHYAYWRSGNINFDGIPNPGTFTLNSDNTIVNVQGTYITSGSGTYDPNLGVFDITYINSIWSEPIHVVFTKQ